MGNSIIDKLIKDLAKKGIERITNYEQVDRLPSGSIMFDSILGGGYPRGRITEIFGWESQGKSTLALLAAAYCLRMNPDSNVAYLDVEQTYDPKWADKIGIDGDRLILFKPDSVEETWNICLELIKSNQFDLIVVDSIGALAANAELESDDLNDNTVAAVARKNSQFLRISKKPLGDSKTALLFINQMTTKIGASKYEDPFTTPGGGRIKFFASIRVQLLSKRNLKKGENIVGWEIRPKTVKNKTFAAHKTCEIRCLIKNPDNPKEDIFQVDLVPEVVDLGKTYGIFSKEDGSIFGGSGKWYFQEELLGRSRDSVISYLRLPENLETYNNILSVLYDRIQSGEIIMEESASEFLFSDELVETIDE